MGITSDTLTTSNTSSGECVYNQPRFQVFCVLSLGCQGAGTQAEITTHICNTASPNHILTPEMQTYTRCEATL
jgi:hypothetical protein